MPPAKKREYRALVNLSVGRVERTPNGREESGERVEKGSTTWLTEQEANNFGRFVRPVADEENTKIPKHVTPRMILGISGVDKSGAMLLENTGALDITNETRILLSEAERDEQAQHTNNPVDPDYRGE